MTLHTDARTTAGTTSIPRQERRQPAGESVLVVTESLDVPQLEAAPAGLSRYQSIRQAIAERRRVRRINRQFRRDQQDFEGALDACSGQPVAEHETRMIWESRP